MAREQCSLVCGTTPLPSKEIAVRLILAIRINLLIIFISMGFVAHSPPNFAAAQQSLGVMPGPVITQKFTHLPLFSKVILHPSPEFKL